LSETRSRRNKPVLGLVGGIGAGKTLVAGLFEELGAAVIDSDRLVHEELRDPRVAVELQQWWGEAVCSPDGAVDRNAVAKIVFSDPTELQRLEGLLYPRLARRRAVLVADHQADPDIRAILLDAPKLYEAGVDVECDAVIFVDADRDVRLQRVAASRGWTEEELVRRENNLEPLDRKRALADYTVVNHSSVAELRSEIERVFASVLTRFS
jgi:dephospho-CoA kinase